MVGSQAILGTFREDELPADATMSVEVDILPIADSNDETARLADLIEGVAGEFSTFEATPVSASMASIWKRRRSRIGGAIGWCKCRTPTRRRRPDTGIFADGSWARSNEVGNRTARLPWRALPERATFRSRASRTSTRMANRYEPALKPAAIESGEHRHVRASSCRCPGRARRREQCSVTRAPVMTLDQYGHLFGDGSTLWPMRWTRRGLRRSLHRVSPTGRGESLRAAPPEFVGGQIGWRPRRDSNSRSRLRRAVLYPLSYGGRHWQAAARSRAERQCTSVASGCARCGAGDIVVVLFSSRAGPVGGARACAGGRGHRPARAHQLCPAGYAHHQPSSGARRLVERAAGCHLLHHSRRTGNATLSSNENSRLVDLRITVDGAPVEVPAYLGIDRVRALQAAVHTHDTSGQVWLEGRHTDAVTLGQFFTVWGVRFDDQCLGSACEGRWSRSTAK